MNDWREGGKASFDIGEEPSFVERPRENMRNIEEILEMIESIRDRIEFYKQEYIYYKGKKDRAGMISAIRNFKALQGAHQSLRWAIGEKGVDHPLF